MQGWIGTLITWGGGLVCFGGGGYLAIRGLIDIVVALGGKDKKTADAMKGLGIGLLGGLFLVAGFGWFYGFVKSKGNEVPHN